MNKDAAYKEAINVIRGKMNVYTKDGEIASIIAGRDEVLDRFGPIFSPENVESITKEEFVPFLYIENNKHWTGLFRQRSRLCADIDALQTTLKVLVDESQPLEDRMNYCADNLKGMGKGLMTAILIVTYPEKYGVWNSTSEAALIKLNVWPRFDHGTSFGAKYKVVNELLCSMAVDLDVDLWTLDSLFWGVLKEPQDPVEPTDGEDGPAPDPDAQRFGLERHLHEFLRDNWERTPLGKEWAIYEEQGEPEKGYEFPCDVGRIDILAKHGKERRWLVIELKRNQGSDDTVGQVTRYMGWVAEELAVEGETVEGMIIAHQANDRLWYSVKMVPNVSLMLYEVQFNLVPSNKPGKPEQ